MPRPFSFRVFTVASSAVLFAALVGYRQSGESQSSPASSSVPRWWRGNLHTHTLWSDGDDFPEMIADWYKEHGYHFLALSDHNVLSQGDRWIGTERFSPKKPLVDALEKYRRRFGSWVEEKEVGNQRLVRLKPLDEFRTLFEERDRFLLIPAEEITDRFERLPVHLNATNIRELIQPQGGSSVVEVMQNNVNAVIEQSRRTGQAMLVHLNHPNFHWGVTAQDLARVRGERFFEVYNGHPGTRNRGDHAHPSTEWMWDYVLATRLSEPAGENMFGLAVDDAHNYHAFGAQRVNPGRGWVMVRSHFLTPESIISAMNAGDFYASTGVTLRDVARDSDYLRIEIAAENGVTYRTEFIGTLKQPAAASKEGSEPEKPEIGQVLAETTDLKPNYQFTGNELYVRARVQSSRPHPNPAEANEFETAWTQPVIPNRD